MNRDDLLPLFAKLPIEEGTDLNQVSYDMAGGLPARMEKWFWEGIRGESVVFRLSDIEDRSDEAVVELVREVFGIIGQLTVKRSGEFLFVNHSFRI
ncbi:hypothetical protein BQ8794_10149 [Mesorhizobium prunaredense]|uniref:Uncharacterized protein n=1 Tax=Mesorhizobium prunaredense TaxID=1631249 RepID=A0A1R3UYR3_9HYPH|nr:hypothetical protein [Mesorhizobium prunaredense]SIT52779.1 hypothetical protein BQ8794_10149 [Mesorhizobium prunaredense]